MVKIGELAKRTGCSVQAIRYYEKEQLLPSAHRSEGNFRLYDHSMIEKIMFIKRCRSMDLSIAEIRHLIDINRSPHVHCDDVNLLFEAHITQVERRLGELGKLRDQLISLRDSCTDNRTIEECGILDSLRSGPLEEA